MPQSKLRWAICPIDGCEYAEEYDPNAAHFCPECGMELVSECPECSSPVSAEDQMSCTDCGMSLKE